MGAEFSKTYVRLGLGFPVQGLGQGVGNVRQRFRVQIQLSSSRRTFLLGLDAAGISWRRGTELRVRDVKPADISELKLNREISDVPD